MAVLCWIMIYLWGWITAVMYQKIYLNWDFWTDALWCLVWWWGFLPYHYLVVRDKRAGE